MLVANGTTHRFELATRRRHAWDIVGTARLTSGSRDYLINAFAAHFAEVEVDMHSGRMRVIRYVAAQDSGRIVHPQLAHNQVSGGCYNFSALPCVRNSIWIDAGA
jgi:CO/xanthine dehydrogenase Mo-binding subunit